MSGRDKLLGELEQMVVAAVLRLGDHAYGVSIIDEIAEQTGRSVRSGGLSVTLDRMERKGLLRSRAGDPSDARGGRPRRYVEVTKEGLAAARASRSAMLAMWHDLDEVFDGS
jgi:PadR family transcriptional regulator, regulatory protein PadR